MKNFRRFLIRPRNAAVLVALLLGIAGFFWWRSALSAPVQRHIEAGTQFLQSGQGVAAEREWRQAVVLDPSSAEAWERLGDLYFSTGHWQAAQDAWLKLLALRPETPDLLTHLAACALKLGDKSKADIYVEGALRQNANDVAALRLALTLTQMEDRHDDWFHYLERLVELQPNDRPSTMNLSIELYQRAQYKKVRLLTSRVLQKDSNFAPAYYVRGLALFADNPTPTQLRQAEADLKKTLKLNPREIEAHRYLARVYMSLGCPDEAIIHFEALGRGRPYASAHWLELSNAYRQDGKTQQAEILRQRFVSIERINRAIVDVQNRLAVDQKSFKNYLQMGRLLLQSLSSSEDTYQLCAHYYAEGQIQGVEFYARKCLQLRPGDAQAETLLRQIEQAHLQQLKSGQQALARKDYQQAERYLRRAALLRPNDARTKAALQQMPTDRKTAS